MIFIKFWQFWQHVGFKKVLIKLDLFDEKVNFCVDYKVADVGFWNGHLPSNLIKVVMDSLDIFFALSTVLTFQINVNDRRI